MILRVVPGHAILVRHLLTRPRLDASPLQTDPTLARTVMVSTKLDTRIPQFARGQDVELFLHPPGRQLEPSMLGGSPFFTCAPVGFLMSQ